MSAQDDTYTYDRSVDDGGPYVPDVDDLGGADLEDDTQNPPQQGEEPYAGMFNEVRRNVAGVNRCIWWATIWVNCSGTTYSIIAVDGMPSTDRVTSANITPSRSSAGVVVLSWDAGTFPAMARTPRAWQTAAFGHAYGEVTTANSVTINLANTSGTAADRSFAVELR